jgi:hypothetical protein
MPAASIGGDLGFRIAFAARDDGAGVPYAAAGRPSVAGELIKL